MDRTITTLYLSLVAFGFLLGTLVGGVQAVLFFF